MSEMNHLWLASSSVPRDIFPLLFLAMMMNRFLGRSNYWRRYLQPQRQDDQVLVMLQRMLYSDSPFVEPVFRLRLMSRFGITIYLINALMRPGGRLNCPVNRFFFQAFDRVKRCFLSPPDQIRRAITMLSNPFFQTPPFHFSFSIDGFLSWDEQLRFNLMNSFLRSIPSDFAELPDFLAYVHELIVAENPFWKSLVEIFIGHYFDNRFGCSISCQAALDIMKDAIELSHHSEDFKKFARLFQHGNDQEVSDPNDLDSYLQVIERFITCMLQSLPILPAIRFENNLICFSPKTQLSSEGRTLSARIRQILKEIHSLKNFCHCDDLINFLNDKNFEDNEQCLAYRVVYRGFEILLKMIQLIQESNGAIYTLIHAHIMIQKSAIPDEKRKLYAMLDLSNIARTFLMENDEDEEQKRDDFEVFSCVTCSIRSYMNLANKEKIIPFLMDFLLDQNSLQFLKNLLMCGDDHDLEEFAKNFMNKQELVRLFREYIQENPKTWCRA